MLDYVMHDYWAKNGDPRMSPLFFMSSLWPFTLILIAYLSFVLWIGPNFMKNRKPFSLKSTMFVYNIVMCAANAYFFYLTMRYHDFARDMFKLDFPSLKDRRPETLETLSYHNFYLMTKILDLADTIFFVLRKKQSHITVLHVYHHASIPLLGWIHLRLCGNSALDVWFGAINTLVHTIMYAYYGLSVLGPQMQPYLWWKRYLTQLQLVQFALTLVFVTCFTLFQRGYPLLICVNMAFQAVVYLVLFGRFYLRTYRAKADGARKKTDEISNDVNNNLHLQSKIQ